MKTLVKSHLSILLIFLVTTLLGVQTSAQSGMFEGAQESGIYTSLSKAFDDLNKGWLQEVKELAKEDAQSLSWGNYEIVKGKGFYKKKDYEPDMFCLYDKSTGKYIIPPATRKEQELYQKHQIPAGTYWPERMFFLGSGKGSMAGAPKEFDGCIWMEYKVFVKPDSVYKDEKKVLNKKGETGPASRAGLFRIVNSELQEIFSFSSFCNFEHSVYGAAGKWEVLNKKSPYICNYDLYIEMVQAHPETNYLIRKSSHIKAFNHTYGKEALFTHYTKARLYDWSGKPISDEVDNIFTEDGLLYLKDGKNTKVLDSNLEEVYEGYTALTPVTIGNCINGMIARKDEKWGLLNNDGTTLIPFIFASYDSVTETVKRVFKKLSYTLWYKAEASKYIEKGEYEKTDHYNARVADPALQEKYIEEMMQGSKDNYLKSVRSKITLNIIGKYNADRECFTIAPICKENGAPLLWHSFNLNVPIAEAPLFKETFDAIKEAALAGAKLSIKDDVVAIDSITFTTPAGKSYSTIFTDTNN